MIEGHIRMDSEFNREAAIALCQRGAQKVDGGGYQFTRDLRAKMVSTITQGPAWVDYQLSSLILASFIT